MKPNVSESATMLITLPSAELMLERLCKFNSDQHAQQKLYPKLTKLAGQEKYPSGVIMLITLAIHDYCDGMPPMMANLMVMAIPQLIESLVPDPAQCEIVVNLFNQMNQSKEGR